MNYTKSVNFFEQFEIVATKYASSDAIIFNQKKITYKELADQSSIIAAFLQQKIQIPGQTIGILMERGIEAIVSILGILKAGHHYMPLDASYPLKRLEYMMRKSECQHLIHSGNITYPFQHVNFHEFQQIIENKTNTYQKSPYSDSDIVYLLFTSGSTGKPKGVLMPYRSLNNLICWQSENSVAGLASKTLHFAPLSFDVSFQEIFATLTTGGILVIASEETRKNPGLLLNLLLTEKIERIILPNIALQILSDEAIKSQTHLNSLKEVITSGEQLKISKRIRDFIQLTQADLINQYGPTETHVITSHRLKKDEIDNWPELPPIGKAIDNCHVYLLNEQLEKVSNGIEAEIYLSGLALAEGYVNNPELTNASFIENPFVKGQKIYKTGDIGKLNSSGEIEFSGRKDEQVKIRGFRVELGEIEVQLTAIEGVSEAAVVARESYGGNKTLIAYLQTTQQINIPNIRAKLADSLPEYMIPAFFEFISEFPKTPSGKLDKKSVPVFKNYLQ